MRKWLRYTALALAAAVLVTVAAGCDIYLAAGRGDDAGV